MSTTPTPISDQFIVLKAGRFDTQNGLGAAGLKQVFEEIKTAKPVRLVIHFHGGLVSRESGETAAAKLMPLYSGTGAMPLFIIWETGWKEIIEQNVPSILSENIFTRLVRKVAQFVKGKGDKEIGDEATKAIVELPLSKEFEIKTELDKGQTGQPIFSESGLYQLPADVELTPAERKQIEDNIKADDQLRTYLQEIANARQEPGEEVTRSITATGSTKTLMSPEVLNDIAPVEEGTKGVISTVMLAKHVVTIVASVISRLARKRDHGVYLTIVEEVMREFYVRNAGKFLWDGMKKEVDQAFEFSDDSGGAAFVEHIQEMWDAGVKPAITLVGHSAGSIYVSRLLKELDNKFKASPQFNVNVVFLAPAVTFTTFADAIKFAGNRIAGLRVFGMGDTWERKDKIFGPIYPASLLYFVSGVLEENRDEPLVGMQRYYAKPYEGSGYETLAYVRAFGFMKRKYGQVWSDADQGPGLSCDMHSHGGWADAAATRDSVMAIIKDGYGSAE